MKRHELLALLYGAPAAICEGFHTLLANASDETVETMAASFRNSAGRASASPAERVALIPVTGIISGGAPEMFEEMGLATSPEKITKQVTAAAASPEIDHIVMAFNTPGGSTRGLPETAAAIAAAAKVKPVTAQVQYLAASAGYWLASQASEIVASPSAEVGSIGVYTMHVDESEALAKEGVKVTYIYAGKHKVEGNRAEPLSKDALAYMQRQVDASYDEFTNAVATGRGVDLAKARGPEFGEGRVMGTEAALDGGLIDSVATFGQTVARVLETVAESKQAAAPAERGSTVNMRARRLALFRS